MPRRGDTGGSPSLEDGLLASKRVIIAHPDPYACGRLASRLYRTGLFAVDTAQDGFEAAAKLYTNVYDCLILHSQIPGLQPVRAVNQIRSAPGMARMPILVLCADSDPSTLQTLKSMGETYLLVEPFDPNELSETIARLTRVRRRTHRAASAGREPGAAASQQAPEPDAQSPGPPGAEGPPPEPDELDVFAPKAVGRAPVVPEPGPAAARDDNQPAQPLLDTDEPLFSDPAAATAGTGTPDDLTPAVEPGLLESSAPSSSEDDLAVEPRPRRHSEPGRGPSTSVGMGLTDVIWYRAERGAAIPGFPPGASRLDDLISGRLGDVLSKDIIAIDQSLAVAILKQANSAEFSGMEKVAGLDQAMLRVGQRGVARHVITTWEARSKIAPPTRAFLLGDYWRHCLTVACIAEEIAAHLRYRSCDAVYSAGLLHDVGKLFFVTYFREDYERVTAEAAEDNNLFGGPLDISPYERTVLKVDHGVIGHELCRAWLLPPVVQAGTLHHVLSTERSRRLTDSLVTMIVALANLVEHTLCRVQEQKYADGYPHDPTMSDLDADLETVAQEVLQGFYSSIYSTVPFWVHQFLRGKQVPLRQVYDAALRRVKRATRRAELQAYSPRWAGGTREDRKAG
jgi:putative nucleotidyltransferase with HDIG domain